MLIDDLRLFKQRSCNNSYFNVSTITGLTEERLVDILEKNAEMTPEEKDHLSMLLG